MYILPDALAPLAAWRQFILVRLTPRDGHPGKSEKFPAWPHDAPTTMTLADGRVVAVHKYGNYDAHNPACWMTWQEAAALAAAAPVGGPTIGWCIGFVLTASDPFGCIDLDGCAEAGGWNANAQMIMARMPGAYELSLSGTGLHGWFAYSGAPPEHGKRNGHIGAELYTQKRFIALGHTASGTIYDHTNTLPLFINEFFPPLADLDFGGGWTTGPVAEYTPLTDEEVRHKAAAHVRTQSAEAVFAGGPPLPSFHDLWTRNLAVLTRAYPTDQPGKEYDYSEADFALAKELAYWTGKDCARVERLMRQSALVREKWDERRGGSTYGMLTIQRGVSACANVYHRPPTVAPTTAITSGRLEPQIIDPSSTYIAREELAVIFKDCVYIQDMNSILLPNGDIVDQARFNAKFAGYAFGMDDACEKTTKSAWEAFLSNQVIRFPRAEGTEFNPRLEYQHVVERGGRHWVNVYKRPVVDRTPGDTAPFMDLLRRLFPNGDDALILLSYMAAVVQYPGVKFRWAPFIQGTRGNGKSTIIECLKHALGHKYIFTLKAGMIENGFNAWLENNVLYVADDIYSVKDRTDMMEALKSLITARDHAITLKGIDSIQKRICGNFIFMDNHKDAMKKQEDTRDLCVLYCAQQSKADRVRDGLTNQFFVKSFVPYLENGGYQAVAEMLHTMEIDPRYNPAGECQEAPESSATALAVRDGRTGLEHDVQELIDLEEPGFAGNFVSFQMLRKRMEDMPQYRRSITPLKATEMLGRLGYDPHPALDGGRLPVWVKPDDTRPVVYVKRGTMQAAQTDPALIAALYVQAQSAAEVAQTQRRFNHAI